MRVYKKYDAHCAYCGKDLLYKEMQVDHIEPQWQGENHNIENLNPSCSQCNHYKRANSLEAYRELVKTLHQRLTKPYINKVALDYGIIILRPFDGKFYFER